MMKLLIAVFVVIVATENIVAEGKTETEAKTNKSQVSSEEILELKMAALESKQVLLAAYQATLDAQLARQNAALEKWKAEQKALLEKWKAEQEMRDKKIINDAQALLTRAAERQSNVSFLARSSSTQTVGSNAIVSFGSVLHNTAPRGYGFDSSINRFRCPSNGIYVFHFSCTTNYGNYAWYQFGIMKGNTVLSSTRANTASQNPHEAMSASAATPCSKGEYVYVKNLQSSSRALYMGTDIHFTGFKIY